ncbi:DUF1631 domain-containing protein [Piscinibacter aquaticus]|uniref:DUF1631 domain-containing protein n=1 Tax=Piscinibacter aquaticus TaxID=392597 RepID=A0A5C6TXL3_9BURK|nr:DUF1631 domain-containing protein [Piscinibacter aquaticus]
MTGGAPGARGRKADTPPMNLSDPRQKAAIDAAVSQINKTTASVADRVSDLLGTLSISATKTAERDALLAAQFDLRRNMAAFHRLSRHAARVHHQGSGAARRRPPTTGGDRLAVAEPGRRQRGRAEALRRPHRGADRTGVRVGAGRGVVAHGRAAEHRAPRRRPQPAAAVQHRPGRLPGHRGRHASAGSTQGAGPRDGHCAGQGDEAVLRGHPARSAGARREVGRPERARRRRPWLPPAGRRQLRLCHAAAQRIPFHGGFAQSSGFGPQEAAAPAYPRGPGLAGLPAVGASSGSGTLSRAELGHRVAAASSRADAELMTLLRRLNSLASRPGELDPGPGAGLGRSGFHSTGRPGLAGMAGDSRFPRGSAGTSGGGLYGDKLTGLMAVNLIRAHREELMQASSGKLDHMVIDVVGSLFDQILSDPRVPPQMARQIARLQLPVLRVAMHDSTFFSSRRHPVRRFVNRIASAACAFDDFDDGPGKELLDRVKQLVQEIVEGDFDQIEIYTAKLADLEQFIADQTQRQIQQTPAAATLENKESELRIQQRYMLQLATALKPMSLPPYLREFVSQVWSRALVLAIRRDGAASDRYARFKRAGRDLGDERAAQGFADPAQEVPDAAAAADEGPQRRPAMIGWPEAAQKAFFAQLLPAHAESLKAPPMSELDHNLLAKQIEGVFNTTVPGVDSLSVADVVPEVESEVIEKRFTPEEARQVGWWKRARSTGRARSTSSSTTRWPATPSLTGCTAARIRCPAISAWTSTST